MSGLEGLRAGMQVYGADKQLIGTVESRWGTGFEIGGQQIPADAIERVTSDTVHLKLAGSALRARHDTGGQAGAQTAARGEEAVVTGEIVERQQGTDTVPTERVDAVERPAQPGAARGAAATRAEPAGRESGAVAPEPRGEREQPAGGAEDAWEALREEIHEDADRAREQ